MALSESIAAYEDCFEYFERAQASERGIRIIVSDYKQACLLRIRLNQARVLQRREAMRIYEREDPRYGKSENDRYRVTLRPVAEGEEGHWVYIEPWAQAVVDVEEL